jgi:hypothetical protein
MLPWEPMVEHLQHLLDRLPGPRSGTACLHHRRELNHRPHPEGGRRSRDELQRALGGCQRVGPVAAKRRDRRACLVQAPIAPARSQRRSRLLERELGGREAPR